MTLKSGSEMPRITKRNPPKRFMTIDASTKSLAYTIIDAGKVVEVGKIEFAGATLNEKLNDIAVKSYAFFVENQVDDVVIEDTIYVNSRQAVTALSKCQGALLGSAYLAGVAKTHRVSPIAWQNHIGNKLLSATERQEMRKQYPNKKPSWYKAKERSIRKQRTMDTVNDKFGLQLHDDDMADSVGLAMFCLDEWAKVLSYGK